MNLGIETIGTLIAFCLTLLVYAYLIKDIPFFHAIYRLVAYLFVGVSLGYAAVMAWHSVLVPRLFDHLGSGKWSYLAPLILCLLLLSKVNRPLSGLGNVTIAFLFGVGAALAIGGGLIGTLFPQIEATFVSLNPLHYQGRAAQEGTTTAVVYALDALLIVVGTVSTLLYFYFSTEGGSQGIARLRSPILRLATGFGKVFMMFTFGALFATTAISRISLLIDRVRFILVTVWSFVPEL
jgi:hypothetical protein